MVLTNPCCDKTLYLFECAINHTKYPWQGFNHFEILSTFLVIYLRIAQSSEELLWLSG